MANTHKYEFEDLNVESCFKNFYVVPDYQREYVWEAEKQVAQLLSDIHEAYTNDRNKEYFLGTTVVFNNNGIKELIDGQQRTTTLFLILCAFYKIYIENHLSTSVIEQHIKNDTFDDDGQVVNKFHLELQYEETSSLLANIFLDIISDKGASASCDKIIAAYKYICQFIREEVKGDTSELKGFFMYFFRSLKFIQILTPDINDALKIFETINDRGVGLSPMDLLKNLIFRQVPRDKFYVLKDKWKVLVDTLDEAKEKPLRFLRYFIVSNYPSTQNGNAAKKGENVIREEEIFDWMSSHANICGYEKHPIAFIELLIENAKCYVNFAHGKDPQSNDNVYLQNIYKLGGSQFRQHLALLLAARKFDNAMFSYLCKCLESYLYYCLLTKEAARTYEIMFGRWNILLKDVNTMEDLKGFVANTIGQDYEKRKATYKNMFMVYKQSDFQLYRIKYILARMTQYVNQAKTGVFIPESLDSYIKKGVEIEHILPQTPIPGISEDIEDYDLQKSMLGNLTLLEKSINSVVSNKAYKDKVDDYGKSQYYLTSSLCKIENVGSNTVINKVNQKLKSFNKWDAETIQQRQEMMYNLSLDIWNLDAT